MKNIPATTLPMLSILVLIALWIYFFIYSYRHKVKYPWGFSIVIIGILVSGFGYHFYDNQVVVFSITLSLVVSMIGILWNITDVRNQFYVQNIGEFLRFIGTGLIFGLLFGFFIQITQGTKYIQVELHRFTITALIAISIQGSMAEEFLFRGYFLSYLKKYKFNQFFAVVFQAIIFTVLHIPRNLGDLLAIFIIFLIGVTAGYLTWKYNNLISALILHIVVNLMAVIVASTF